MMSQPQDTSTQVVPPEACSRCGALIPSSERGRHDAWHEFVESAIAGLTADLASLQPLDETS